MAMTTATWQAVPGAISYEVSIDGANPVSVTGTSYEFDAAAGMCGIYQVRAVNPAGKSAWSYSRYQVSDSETEMPLSELSYTAAHGGWVKGQEAKVLKAFFLPTANGGFPMKTAFKDKTGKAIAFEYAHNSVNGEEFAEGDPSRIKLGNQKLQTINGSLSKDGAAVLISFDGEGHIENKDTIRSGWEQGIGAAKATVVVKETAGQKVWALSSFAPATSGAYMSHYGATEVPVKEGDKGIELRRLDGVVRYSVVRKDNTREPICAFRCWMNKYGANDPVEIYGWRWGNLTIRQMAGKG